MNFKKVLIWGILSLLCLLICDCYYLILISKGQTPRLKKKGYYNIMMAQIILLPVSFVVFARIWVPKLFLRKKLKVKKIIPPTDNKND